MLELIRRERLSLESDIEIFLLPNVFLNNFFSDVSLIYCVDAIKTKEEMRQMKKDLRVAYPMEVIPNTSSTCGAFTLCTFIIACVRITPPLIQVEVHVSLDRTVIDGGLPL